MIILNKANMGKHSQLKSHEAQERGQRMYHNRVQKQLMQADPSVMQVNARGVYSNDFWLELDRSAAEVAQDTRGREIYDDLQSLVTVLPIGKTVKAYTNAGSIAKDVKISMDGSSPFTFDQTGYSGDGDPLPIFTSGYGLSWRHAMGAEAGNLPLMIDSQRAKLEVFYATTNHYALNGSDRISEASYKGQGLKNHRHTAKINLGTGGSNIDLSAASTTNDDIVKFFTQDFAAVLDENNIPMVDVFWISKEIAARMGAPFSASTGFKEGTLAENIQRLQPRIKEFRVSYNTDLVAVEHLTGGVTGGLVGNEFLAYVKSKSFIEVPTGQAVQIVPLARINPRDGFNNDISTSFGIQVKKSRGNSGVFYGADLD